MCMLLVVVHSRYEFVRIFDITPPPAFSRVIFSDWLSSCLTQVCQSLVDFSPSLVKHTTPSDSCTCLVHSSLLFWHWLSHSFIVLTVQLNQLNLFSVCDCLSFLPFWVTTADKLDDVTRLLSFSLSLFFSSLSTERLSRSFCQLSPSRERASPPRD